ncbi:hypothetical protein QBC46DRAFT_374359 [Diplogelasinospora grovesii]|uniref:Uncharacterized protein n=1 Tax=Diplogelasinospora grovesii TaxID=303347 RepID=A0AAN6NET8_9PEZI|nr:hypothetical protein QBC46DRAFT_374359 [Diplogelasinospora grovesii]
MFKSILALLIITLAAMATAGAPRGPKPPALTYLFTVNNSLSTGVTISPTRSAIPITSGAFAGPKLNGTLLSIGVDFYDRDAAGNIYPDAAYVMQTSDGANIIARARGHAPVEYITFETGAPQYAWLNGIVGVTYVSLIPGAVRIDVWQWGPDLTTNGRNCWEG